MCIVYNSIVVYGLLERTLSPEHVTIFLDLFVHICHWLSKFILYEHCLWYNYHYCNYIGILVHILQNLSPDIGFSSYIVYRTCHWICSACTVHCYSSCHQLCRFFCTLYTALYLLPTTVYTVVLSVHCRQYLSLTM